MINQRYVDAYMKMFDDGLIIVNRERELLFKWVREKIYTRNDFEFDDEQIDDCIAFIEKWFFKLEPFQKFLIAFVFLYHRGKRKVVFNKHFWTMARGAGKNGLMSGISMYLTSSRYGVKGYNVGIVATSEDQATTSVEECYNVIDDHILLQKYFKHNLSKITCRANRNWFKFYTSNAKTKDGARLGCIIFDEIHEYMTNDIIEVFTSGFGKRKHSRRFFIGTTGFVRDGVYDQLMERALSILTGMNSDLTFFPFICRLDDIHDVTDQSFWQKANPMFHEPMSEYAETLFDEVMTDYDDLMYGGDKIKFIVKRMNFDEIDSQQNVAPKKNIDACNVELPDLSGESAIGTLDLSTNKDFTAMGLLFRKEDMYYYDTHTLVPKSFLDNYQVSIPVDEWSIASFDGKREPLLTIVHEVDIPIERVVDWFIWKREKYNIKTIVIDYYRKDYAQKALEEAGFEVVVVRKSNAIAAGIGIRIQSLFSRFKLHWGNNPLMNWYTNNVYVYRDNNENVQFGKKGKVRRKTDGFMALLLGVWKSDDLISEAPKDFMFADFWD